MPKKVEKINDYLFIDTYKCLMRRHWLALIFLNEIYIGLQFVVIILAAAAAEQRYLCKVHAHHEWNIHRLSLLDAMSKLVLSVEFSRYSRAGRRTGRAGPVRSGPGLSYASCHYNKYPTRYVDAQTHRGLVEDSIAPEDGLSVTFNMASYLCYKVTSTLSCTVIEIMIFSFKPELKSIAIYARGRCRQFLMKDNEKATMMS